MVPWRGPEEHCPSQYLRHIDALLLNPRSLGWALGQHFTMLPRSLWPSAFSSSLLVLSFLISTSSGRLHDGLVHGNMPRRPTIPEVRLGARASLPVVDVNGNELPPYNTVYYFDQRIDHNRPYLGTFKQRFWHTAEYYKPGKWLTVKVQKHHLTRIKGGPIILSTPGERNADCKHRSAS